MQVMKPMLAASLTKGLGSINYPVLMSEKIDGIRCLLGPDGPVTRTGKPIPNKYVRERLSEIYEELFKGKFNYIDGELVIDGCDFNATQSAIMNREGEPNVVYKVFDCLADNSKEAYFSRVSKLYIFFYHKDLEWTVPISNDKVLVEFLDYKMVHTPEQACSVHQSHLDKGGEGSIIRSLNGPYKFGRSTEKEGYLIKVKSFEDYEATVVGFEPLEEVLDGSKYKDSFGGTHYSKAKGLTNQVEELGALVVEGPYNGSLKTFRIGTGFDASLRRTIWTNREDYLGKLVTYKCMSDPTKSLDKPRHPVFKGFRSKEDI